VRGHEDSGWGGGVTTQALERFGRPPEGEVEEAECALAQDRGEARAACRHETTDLVVATAPPERSGAAASLSETSGVLGGALGIAMIGSAATAVYRDEAAETLPAGIPPGAAETARDTLGGAIGAAEQLPDPLAAALTAAATEAFTEAVHLAAAASAVLMVATAILASILLQRAESSAESEPLTKGRDLPPDGTMRSPATGG
jgi:hypothetical protein